MIALQEQPASDRVAPLVRVTRKSPCAICGHPDWCSRSANGAFVICMRQQSTRPTKNGGFVHYLVAASRAWPARCRRVEVPCGHTRKDLPELIKRYQAAVRPDHLQRFADSLALTLSSLIRLGIGWASEHCAWALPMHDAGGQVIGVRLRRAHGRKFAVRGSREGLFLPPDLQIGGQLLIAEGPTDCAALLDLGFSAIGRPSCAGGTGLISAFVRDRRPAFVEIVADADEPGQRGATSLASLLALYCRRVRVIAPPLGIKDARAWKQAGATAADIQAAINAVSFHKLAIVVRRIGRKGARRVW